MYGQAGNDWIGLIILELLRAMGWEPMLVVTIVLWNIDMVQQGLKPPLHLFFTLH